MAERTGTGTYTYRVCDSCTGQLGVKQCVVCGRDACPQCRALTPEYGLVCVFCWDVGRQFRDRIDELRQTCEAQVSRVMADWATLRKCEDKG